MVPRSVLFVCELIPPVWLTNAHWGFEGLSNALALLNVPLAQPCEDTVNEGHWQIYPFHYLIVKFFKELNTICTISILSSLSYKNRSVNILCYWASNKNKNYLIKYEDKKKKSNLKLSRSLQLLDLTVPCWICLLYFTFLVMKERLRYNILAILSATA